MFQFLAMMDHTAPGDMVKAMLLGLVVTGSLFIFHLVAYRIFFHPLAKFPGPLLAKFTNLYAAYHAWKGDIHIDIMRCHQKYGTQACSQVQDKLLNMMIIGDRVRYSPNRIVINTPEALRDIYGHAARVRKYDGYNMLASQAPNLFTLSDKTQHGRRRRVISQAFSESSLRIFEPIILSRIHRFCAKLRSQSMAANGWSQPLDMACQFNNLTFDSMTAVAFSVDYNAIEKPDFRYVRESISKANLRLSVIVQAPELTIARLDRRLFSGSAMAGYRFVKFLRKLLSTRLTNATNSQDLFWFLKQCKDPDTGEALSTTELSTETATFLVAGSDTTSTAMAALSYYLSSHPRCYTQVANEVHSTFAARDEIRLGPALNSCVFLRACIDETLRLSPPAGSALWRQVEKGGATIGTDFLPEGVEVGVGTYALHHHLDYWEEPFTFKPERWLNKNKTTKTTRGESSMPYSPFSHGPRNCVGKPLALNQIMLTFAFLFWEFDFRTGDTLEKRGETREDTFEFVLEEHISGKADGPFLCFRVRS
ncbi:cytochrome P450 [Xylaria venustula]|nr:cytochrome P450 [Xylaria venustula]